MKLHIWEVKCLFHIISRLRNIILLSFFPQPFKGRVPYRTGGRLDLAHKLQFANSCPNAKDQWKYTPEAADGRFLSMRFPTAHYYPQKKDLAHGQLLHPESPLTTMPSSQDCLTLIFAPSVFSILK